MANDDTKNEHSENENENEGGETGRKRNRGKLTSLGAAKKGKKSRSSPANHRECYYFRSTCKEEARTPP